MPTSPPRWPQLRTRTLMILVALSAIVSFLGSWLLKSGLFDHYPSEPEIHAMGDHLVAQIETWRAKHGRYPASLAEAGLVSPTNVLGGFYYFKKIGDRFLLNIGLEDGHIHRCQTCAGDLTLNRSRWDCS